MRPPRYRTLDGDEVELPMAMDRWVLVPRALARFDPELTWALDYDDAPQPEDADPRLDFAEGALLVPVELWNDHAALEPNLAPCRFATGFATPMATHPPRAWPIAARRPEGAYFDFGISVAGVVARIAKVGLAALAVAYVVAVGAWLWGLRDIITGPDVSTGLLLVGAAMLLAWLSGVAGAVPRARSAMMISRAPTASALGAGLGNLTNHPLGILRLGLAVQLVGFVALVAMR